MLIALGVSYLIHRYLLTGDLAFALYAALWAAAGAAIELMRIDYSARFYGLRSSVIAMLLILVLAVGYLAVDARSRRLRASLPAQEPSARHRMLRPRSSQATAGRIGLTGIALTVTGLTGTELTVTGLTGTGLTGTGLTDTEAGGDSGEPPPDAVPGPQLQR